MTNYRDIALDLLAAVMGGDCVDHEERWALIARATAALGAPESPHDCAECGRATLVPCADCAALEDAWAECPLDYNWYDYAPVKDGDRVVCYECSRRIPGRVAITREPMWVLR